MTGNATHRYRNAAVLAVVAVDATETVTSADLDARLADTLERVGLRPGMLARLVGIRERRWWGADTTFVQAAATAGAKAVSESGVDPAEIGLMVNTSISRNHLEPSTAVAIHHTMGLPSSCQNFDITNACLGFVNGIELAASMIDAGQVEHALVVDAEDSQTVMEATLDRLSATDVTADEVMSQFAALTLGSGAAAMVLGRADRYPAGHRVVASVSRAGTEHHELCIGDNATMFTDLKGLLDAGLDLSQALWEESAPEFGWDEGIERYVLHQVSQVHNQAMCERLGIDLERVPLTFPDRGNMGPVSVPFTLATQVGSLDAGDRVLLMGIGSGLNASVLEIEW